MKRSVLAALVAVVLALVGCVAVVLYVRGADARALAGQRAVRVLVVHKLIPTGTTGQQIRAGGYTETLTMSAAPDVSSGRPTGAEAVVLPRPAPVVRKSKKERMAGSAD